MEANNDFSLWDAAGCAGRVISRMSRITLKNLVVLMKSQVIALVILNALLLFIAAYGVWGAFWIWQPGADPPQLVPLYGSQSYIQSVVQTLEHKGYNVTTAALVYGFLTYHVDIWVDGTQKLGVTRFDWTQFALTLLAIFDGWTLIDFLRTRRTGKSRCTKS